MKYLIAGTTVMNKSEVIKSLESLWDAQDAKDESFEVVMRGTANDAANDPETVGVIKNWVVETECLVEFVSHNEQVPEVDAVLALVGEDPDDDTTLVITHYIDSGVPVYDLASQMAQLQFDTEHVVEEPPTETPDPPVRDSLEVGWPGEDPVVPSPAVDETPSREVPAKVQEVAQEPQEAVSEDPADVLKGVSETDLERMSKPELKALVERLGLTADKRSPGSMINALMEVVIALDKGEDIKAYGAEADTYFDATESLTDTLVGDTTTQEFMDAQDGCPNDPDQTPEEFLAASIASLAAASGVHEVSRGSVPTITVVAKFIETVYSDGSVTKVPIDTF